MSLLLEINNLVKTSTQDCGQTITLLDVLVLESNTKPWMNSQRAIYLDNFKPIHCLFYEIINERCCFGCAHILGQTGLDLNIAISE